MSITFSHDIQAGALTGPGDDLGLVEVVDFAAGLPGFPGVRRFLLEDLGESLRPFRRLRSVGGEPEVSFTVVEPGLLFGNYTVEIDDDHQASLGVASAGEVLTLVLVTVPRPPLPPTANLLGPIVVNKTTGAAAQVVQHKSGYKVAEPLPGVS